MTIAAYGRNTERAVQALLKVNGGVKVHVDPDIRTGTITDDKIARLKRKRQEQEEYLKRTQKEARDAIRRANERLAFLRRTATFESIVTRLCKASGVSPHELFSDRRNAYVVLIRQAICYWACRRTNLSLPDIGRRMGGRDHTTILHSKNAYPKKRAQMGRYLKPAR